MIQIPIQLQNENFRFVLIKKNTKEPIGKDWQLIENTYSFKDEKLWNHLANNGSYGVHCGAGNLFILDLDTKNATADDFERLSKFETFQVRTGGGGLHLYFTCTESIRSIEELKDKQSLSLTIGEFRYWNVQCVGPNSDYKSGLTKYEVFKDLPIWNFSRLEGFQKFYNEIIAPLRKDRGIVLNDIPTNDLQIGVSDKEVDTSRSTLDFNNLRKLIQAGLTDEQIQIKMQENSIRWNQIPVIKQKWEIGNAHKSLEKYPIAGTVTKKKIENLMPGEKPVEEKVILPLKIISVSDLMKKEFKPHEYFLNKFIPKNSIILLGGKSGKFKTGLALSLLLAMSRGQSFLDVFTATDSPKILYYELDNNGERSLMWKIKYLMNGNNYDNDVMERFDFAPDFDSYFLYKELEHIKPYDIIVLDSYRRFLKGDENQSKVTNEFFVDFLKKAKEMGKTIIVLHHFKKSKFDSNDPDPDLIDSFRGSTDIVSQFDVVYGITKTEDIEDIEKKTTTFNVSVKMVKDRDDAVRKQFNFSVLKDEKTVKTLLTFTGYGTAFSEFDLFEKAILVFLKGKLEATSQQILKGVNQTVKCAPRTLRTKLKDLKDFNHIEELSLGRYRLIQSDTN